jgi:hypothetical protein
MRLHALTSAFVAASLTTGCGQALAPSLGQRTLVEARAHHYQDSSGLLVGTYGAGARQRFRGGAVEARALADYVRVEPTRLFDPTQPDRSAPDAVTSASATAGGGAVARKWRFEGQLGGDVEREVRGLPISVGAIARASTERDYRSVSGALRAGADLFERNTRVTAQVGHGRDVVRPVEVARGQEALWPASHRRWAGSLSVTQLLSPVLVLGGGLAATWQRGTLSSPYRRAIVTPNLLLPEALPRARDRYSAFLSLSISLRRDLAFHLQQGAYGDSWRIRALVPEVRLAAEVEDGVLLTGGYRYYGQTAASFYRSTYAAPQSIMSGDVRHGAIRDHTVTLDLRRRARRGWLELPLLAGYQLSVMSYRGVGSRVVAHVFTLGLEAGL